jgi:hypothetical protein
MLTEMVRSLCLTSHSTFRNSSVTIGFVAQVALKSLEPPWWKTSQNWRQCRWPSLVISNRTRFRRTFACHPPKIIHNILERNTMPKCFRENLCTVDQAEMVSFRHFSLGLKAARTLKFQINLFTLRMLSLWRKINRGQVRWTPLKY